MTATSSDPKFLEACECLPEEWREKLGALPGHVQQSVREIRLRAGRPLMLTTGEESLFLDCNGLIRRLKSPSLLTVSSIQIKSVFLKLCSHSVHAHQEEIINGFVTLRGGHRAGICGTAVEEQGKIQNIRDISSINIRVARAVKGASAEFVRRYLREALCGAVLAGPPSSGKTTLLRDIARTLASDPFYKRVAVVDERGEIAAVRDGEAQNDLGDSCDILNGYPKAPGIQQALRTLSPEVILCDELGTLEEVAAVTESLNAGVPVITTVHASNIREVMARRQSAELLQTGAFSLIAMLRGSEKPSEIENVYEVEKLYAQMDWNYGHSPFLRGVREFPRPADETAGRYA